MKTYLHFDLMDLHTNKKTKTWIVRSVQTNTDLGQIRWRATWRKYSFYPEPCTIFDDNCLVEIVEFIRREMAEHCKNREKAKCAKF